MILSITSNNDRVEQTPNNFFYKNGFSTTSTKPTEEFRKKFLSEKPNLEIVELIKLCCANDKEAWDTFIQCFHRRIMLYVHRIVCMYDIKSLNESEVVQEVFLKLLANECRKLKEFKGDTEASFISYLFNITRSTTLDIMRKETAEKRSAPMVSLDLPISVNGEEMFLAEALPNKKDSCFSLEINKKILCEKIIKTLKANFSSHEIKIFCLHTIYGFSANEIAKMPTIDLSRLNVQAIIFRTKEKLRKYTYNMFNSNTY